MPEIVLIAVTETLLDGENPRLENEQSGQQETALKLSEQQGERLVVLAADIVDNGLDPTTLIAVVATAGARKRYKVIEGNRRVLALKALETPSLVTPALAPKDARRLGKLSAEFAKNPIDNVAAVLFDDEDDARHWIELRHTGQNQGRGLVDWGAAEQDRFNARHAGARSPAGQVIDFVDKHGALGADAAASTRKIITNLDRLLSSPKARRGLGVDIVRGEVLALNDQAAVAKSLSRVVEDLKLGTIAVPELYKAADRELYVESLPKTTLPAKSTQLQAPVSLAGLTAGQTTPAKASPKPRTRAPKPRPRTTVIPTGSTLNVTPPRLNAIHNELLTLSTEQFTNACAVLLRVYLELSVDHYIAQEGLSCPSSDPLAKRLKVVAQKLLDDGKIPKPLFKAIEQVANGPSVMAPGVSTFHQYVHNQYAFPKPRELYAAWDELQPFMEQLWP